jgi:exopolysaccharide biosynthesis protein
MKKILSLILMILITASYCAAQSDSIVFVSAGWNTEKIARGVRWKHYSFKNLFGANQYINILEVKNGGKDFDLGYEKQVLKLTSDFGKEAKAIAAINGTFFDVKNGGSVDFIRSNGEVINENRLEEDHSRARHQKAAIALKKGKLQISKWDETEDWEKKIEGEDVMVSGPLLIFNKTAEPLDSSAFAKSRHPRAAIAVVKNKVLLITVDGRDPNAAGMNLYELAKIMKWLGADDGINLDGGGSTTLWIHDQPESGVVNFPSDDKKWGHAGERKVANVLLLK